MKVWLTRKLPAEVHGIDLRGRQPGEVLDLPDAAARLLVAEEWALPERRQVEAAGPRRRAEDKAKRSPVRS